MVDEKDLNEDEVVDEEEEVKEEEPVEEEAELKKKYPEEYKKEAKKKKYPEEEKKEAKKKKPEEDEEEMTDDELEQITTCSELTDFVKKMKGKYPKMPFKAIAQAFKKQRKEDAELDELTESELIERIDSLMSILKRKNKYPYPEEEKKAQELEKLKSDVKELKEKINEPDPKTVHLSSGGSETKDTCEGMVTFLQSLM